MLIFDVHLYVNSSIVARLAGRGCGRWETSSLFSGLAGCLALPKRRTTTVFRFQTPQRCFHPGTGRTGPNRNGCRHYVPGPRQTADLKIDLRFDPR